MEKTIQLNCYCASEIKVIEVYSLLKDGLHHLCYSCERKGAHNNYLLPYDIYRITNSKKTVEKLS